MSDDIGSLDGRDTPSSLSTMDAIDDRIGPDNHIIERVEATFAIRSPLRERRKIVDITDRMSHLTPDVILDGEEPWIRWYWTNVSLVVQGEKTLIDPRDTVKPHGCSMERPRIGPPRISTLQCSLTISSTQGRKWQHTISTMIPSRFGYSSGDRAGCFGLTHQTRLHTTPYLTDTKPPPTETGESTIISMSKIVSS
jgi:hypothetical protein